MYVNGFPLYVLGITHYYPEEGEESYMIQSYPDLVVVMDQMKCDYFTGSGHSEVQILQYELFRSTAELPFCLFLIMACISVSYLTYQAEANLYLTQIED